VFVSGIAVEGLDEPLQLLELLPRGAYTATVNGTRGAWAEQSGVRQGAQTEFADALAIFGRTLMG